MNRRRRVLGQPGGGAMLAFALVLLGLAALGEGPRLALRWERMAWFVGQPWRLVTGHFVHFDLEHALLNVLGLVLVWVLFAATFSLAQWIVIVLAAIAAIDLGLWAVNVELQWYLGLSGVLHAALAAGIVRRVIERDALAGLLGVLGLGKLLYEHLSGALPLLGSGMAVITDAHLYGALAGMLCGAVLRPAEPAVRVPR